MTKKHRVGANRKATQRADESPMLAVQETDNTITIGAAGWDNNFRDRLNYDRSKILTQAITAWRSNPIARRIIELTTEFVIGDGWTFTAPKQVEKFLKDFWNHPLNNLDEQLPEWADEAWRTGDLFLLVSVDGGGQVYVRALPSEAIGIIETTENDYRQEKLYKRDATDENPWPAYDPDADQTAFILHFPSAVPWVPPSVKVTFAICFIGSACTASGWKIVPA